MGGNVYLTAAFLSIILSCWVALRESVINPDAICYLQSAAAMSGGLKAAMHLCGQAMWPFYSMLIYGVVSITHLSWTGAAYFLNGFFSCISVLMFIAIIHFFTHQSRILWFAAAVILLSHEFDSVRYYIIRDHGFWAFYLTSIVLLLHYFRDRTYSAALLWSISMIVATLFRVEGGIFLLVVPWISFFETNQIWVQRFKSFLHLNTITIIVAVFLSVWHFSHPYHQQLGRLHELQFQLQHGVTSLIDNFNLKAAQLGSAVLGPDSIHDAKFVLLIMLTGWYLVSIATNLSLIYSILIVYAWIKKLLKMHRVLLIYLIVNLVITASFLVQHFFFSKRYLIALSLILMVWVPFALEELLQQWRIRKWPFVLALFLMIVSSLGGIFDFGYSKRYIRDAGSWLAQNTPGNAVIYSNDYQVMYYSERFGIEIFTKHLAYADLNVIAHGKWKQYDYLALRIDQQELPRISAILKEINQQPIVIFVNKRGDQVRIYRRKKE
jgi:hypothetical protein